ncbi:hypothetical protein [Flammeovirga sp. SJP92]|uniref:hypothetical protein n=1 Tax=Flammeovirga sp. SJP92 TaxID=1775430 RepID=UPI0007883051|nr:hypothetical protein [Flammeovirga sp. SJP92]KXX68712.1 hypothetical protein AVL50_18745 [Flammeovirga sp. SJP92]
MSTKLYTIGVIRDITQTRGGNSVAYEINYLGKEYIGMTPVSGGFNIEKGEYWGVLFVPSDNEAIYLDLIKDKGPCDSYGYGKIWESLEEIFCR